MNPTSPDDLFAAWLRTGDPARFAALHDQLRDELTRVAERVAPNRAAAEDLVQATFLGALESAGRFERGRKVVPWLIGILHNQTRMMRWRARRTPDAARLAWPEPRDPAELAADREFEQTVTNAFAQLGPVYEPVMQLHLRDEMSAQDIGRKLDRPAGTVRTQVVRGVALLRSLLPAGFASLLLVRVSPGLDAVGVREMLLESAARGRTVSNGRWLAVPRRWLAAALGAVAAVATAIVLTTTGGRGEPSPSPDARTQARMHGDQPPADVTANAAIPTPTADRLLVAAPPTVTTLAVTVTHRGQPTAAFPVQAISSADWRFHRHTQLTNEDGVAHFPGLPAGTWFVIPTNARTHREALLEVIAGREHSKSVDVPSVASLTGRVLDDGNAPVAGATVWLCDGDYEHHFGFGAVPATTTDADGRFTVRHGAANLTHVQVTAPGRRASRLLPLPRGQDETLTFVLAANGGCVHGTVVDTRGAPLDNVLVRAVHAGTRNRVVALTADGSSASMDHLGSVREVRTDDDGRFRIDGFDAGRPVQVVVWDASFARHEAVVAADDPAMRVVLSPGATLRGRLTDAAGKPVVDALVTAGDEPGEEGADTDADDPMREAVRSDTDGRYVLAGITPGDMVSVQARSFPNPVDGSGGSGNAAAQLRLAPGADIEWSPVLELAKGNGFRGTIAMSDGSTLAAFTFLLVAIEEVDGPNHFPVRPDAHGAFEVKNVLRANYRLQVSHDDCVLLQYVVPWPLAERYDVVLPVRAVREQIRYFAEFRAEPEATGTLEVRGRNGHDGFAVFAIDGAGTWRPCPVPLTWNAANASWTAAFAPGRYQGMGLSSPWAAPEHIEAAQAVPFTIAAGQTTVLQAVRRLGVHRTFRIDEPWPHLLAGSGHAEVHDATTGAIVGRWQLWARGNPTPGHLEVAPSLAPGRYRITVETDLGHRGALDFTIDALTPSSEAVTLTVR